MSYNVLGMGDRGLPKKCIAFGFGGSIVIIVFLVGEQC